MRVKNPEKCVGEVHDFLEIIGMAESIHHKTTVKCQCACGEVVIRGLANFRQKGKSPKSCGCKRTDQVRHDTTKKRKHPRILGSLANQLLMKGW